MAYRPQPYRWWFGVNIDRQRRAPVNDIVAGAELFADFFWVAGFLFMPRLKID
jgi:hypothetical protein